MMKRDLAIIKDLERFRVMSRNDIADIHFGHLKNPITNANIVLKRLARDGQIEVGTDFRPYVYFPHGSKMKRNSTKIPHYLELVNVYKQLKKYAEPKVFTVEVRYEKGLCEPDIFTIFKGTPFYIELQRNTYSQAVMDKKIKRYESLYYSGTIEKEPWQKARKVFPYIIMISDTRYEIKSDVLRVFQVPSIHDFMRSVAGEKREVRREQPRVISKRLV
ncbi:replication-relaxation family protein [Ornithinibacillus scapharcae]|uniref:replication-relaxation family protein n=1 Tax=Ornithinibacillus scapharcae TaxID=1147159 RepID=UPI000225B050|nr:replication-relaxation family protein [Ornithinibacillus scapharcae]